MRTHPKSMLVPKILLIGLLLTVGRSLAGAEVTPLQGSQGYIGIRFQKLTPELARESKLPEMKGVLITEVTPQTPGAEAGLKEQDVLIEIDGRETADTEILSTFIRQLPPKKTVVVKFIRDGKNETTTIMVGEMPPAVAYHNRGYDKAINGDLTGAIDDCTEAIRLNPKNARAYLNRGLTKADSDDRNSAINDYTEAIRLNPKYSLAYHNRGLAKANSGDLPGAIADYTETLRLDPQNTQAYLNRGIAKANSGDHGGAIADYTEVLHLNPKNIYAYNGRGWAKANSGDLAGAFADYAEAIRLDPKNAQIHFNRAVAKANSGDLAGAIADYTEVISLNPKNADAYLNRGLARTNSKGQNSRKKPSRSELAAAQKRAAETMADYTEAKRLYTEVIRLNPNYFLAYEYRATARDQMGERDGAAQDRAAAVKIKEQVAFAKFRAEVTKASVTDLLVSAEATEANARERNRALIAAKNRQLPAILRESKTDELATLVVRVEQTILDLNHESEVAKDRAQQVTATNGDAQQAEELRGLNISYRERIELLKPILAAVREEIANRNR